MVKLMQMVHDEKTQWLKDLIKEREVAYKLSEQQKLEKLTREDRERIILSLSDASAAAIKANPPKPTSGLIEMQRLFSKLNKDRPS